LPIDLSYLFTQVLIIVASGIVLSSIIIAITLLGNKKQHSLFKERNPPRIRSQADAPDPVQQLNNEKEASRHEILKLKSKPYEIISYVLLLFGVVSLTVSIICVSSILAFIGLGLTFWGSLLVFIRPAKLVRASLLYSTSLPSLVTLNRILNELKYEGKAVYLPPTHFKELKSGTIFIPSKNEIIIPQVKEVAEGKVFLKNPEGVCFTPPGLALANLYEEELGKDFTKVDLKYLQDNLPELFIEDLEIAEDLEINVKDDMIQAKITGSIYENFCKEVGKLSNVCNSLGCPLCSSIAIALTRTTGKPIIIKKVAFPKDNKTIEVHYQMIEV